MAAAEQQGPGAFYDGAARIKVTFRKPPYEILTDAELALLNPPITEAKRYVTREKAWAIQALPLAKVVGQQLLFTAGPYAGLVIPEAGVLLQGTQQLVYTWHQVPDVPETAHRACLGRVNASQFDPVYGRPAYPPGTLLCQAPKVERKEMVTGRVAWEITYRFDYRPQGWNFFPGPDLNYYPAAQVPPAPAAALKNGAGQAGIAAGWGDIQAGLTLQQAILDATAAATAWINNNPGSGLNIVTISANLTDYFTFLTNPNSVLSVYQGADFSTLFQAVAGVLYQNP
jgi:hypothetical protein